MLSRTIVLEAFGIIALIEIGYGAPFPGVSPQCPKPEAVCGWEPEDTCGHDSDCSTDGTGICCQAHECRSVKICKFLPKVTTRAPTTTQTLTTTKLPTTTQVPTTKKVPTTTQNPTTTIVPTTTQCPKPDPVCGYEPEDTCYDDSDCQPIYEICCQAHECRPTKICKSTGITRPPPTKRTPTTTESPSTTQKPTTTKVPSTTQVPTTTKIPTTKQKPTTTKEPTTKQVPTTTKVPTTTQVPTTIKIPTTTQKPTTTKVPTTTQIPTSSKIPTTTQVPTTKQPTTTQAATTRKTTTVAKPSTSPATTKSPNVCRTNQQKNVLFLVDGTANPRQNAKQVDSEFGEIKHFLKEVTLKLQNDNFMVGVMQFGGRRDLKMDVSFTKGTNMHKLLSELESIKQRKGSERRPGEALQAASNKFYETNTIYDRQDAQDIVVLITRGYFVDLPLAQTEIEMLKTRAARVIIVGVGSSQPSIYFQNYLKSVAPSKSDVHIAKYKDLGKIENSVFEGICSDITVKGGKRSPCEGKPYDVYFVVDGSASISRENFEKKRKFLLDLLNMLKRPEKKTNLNIGIMEFSEVSKTKELMELGKHPLAAELNAVQNMNYHIGQRTMLGHALELFNNTVFNGLGGDRPNAKNILVVFNDGTAHDFPKAIQVAESTKKKGVRIITLSMSNGRSVAVALKQIASEPKYKNAVQVRLSDPSSYVEKVASLICENNKKL